MFYYLPYLPSFQGGVGRTDPKDERKDPSRELRYRKVSSIVLRMATNATCIACGQDIETEGHADGCGNILHCSFRCGEKFDTDAELIEHEDHDCRVVFGLAEPEGWIVDQMVDRALEKKAGIW